jgi:hypothetical protein
MNSRLAQMVKDYFVSINVQITTEPELQVTTTLTTTATTTTTTTTATTTSTTTPTTTTATTTTVSLSPIERNEKVEKIETVKTFTRYHIPAEIKISHGIQSED